MCTNHPASNLQCDFSDPQASKDACDHRQATFKSHMRRFIKEGNDFNNAGDANAAIVKYGEGGEAKYFFALKRSAKIGLFFDGMFFDIQFCVLEIFVMKKKT